VAKGGKTRGNDMRLNAFKGIFLIFFFSPKTAFKYILRRFFVVFYQNSLKYVYRQIRVLDFTDVENFLA